MIVWVSVIVWLSDCDSGVSVIVGVSGCDSGVNGCDSVGE